MFSSLLDVEEHAVSKDAKERGTSKGVKDDLRYRTFRSKSVAKYGKYCNKGCSAEEVRVDKVYHT